MINKVKVEGFRSLVDTAVDLAPMNVLIGPNGSGKSNLLDVLDLIKLASFGFLGAGIQGKGGIAQLRSAVSETTAVKIALSIPTTRGQCWHYAVLLEQMGLQATVAQERLFSVSGERSLFDEPYTENCLLARDGGMAVFFNAQTGQFDTPVSLQDASELALAQVKQPNIYVDATSLGFNLAMIQVYEPIHMGRRSPQRLPRVAASDWFLHSDGSNLANVLSVRLGNDDFQSDFEHYVRLMYPDFRRLHFQPDPSGEGKILPTWHSSSLKRGLGIGELSDGMIAYICLLAILLRPVPESIICIDEPEIGLHPKAMGIVADLLRSASDAAQVIITTHSPSLASHFRPEEVIISRIHDGRTIFERLPQNELADWLAEFSLGELMTMGELERNP